ncbi:chlorohydrolase [Streptococcus pneumoniae]|uniref:lysyl-tRNA synthetase n=1 Tax=Streptococcus pneumoniae TaxID=1313 RepID=UPI000B587792|nr:lysyl-tRNA synthetase [Streptococcus pneumoniae]SNK71525.1 chlorohydrolase [Streptococcus pneumoniae]
MEIEKQTRKLAAGCSKHCFEVADGLTWFEEIFEEKAQNTVLRLQMEADVV